MYWQKQRTYNPCERAREGACDCELASMLVKKIIFDASAPRLKASFLWWVKRKLSYGNPEEAAAALVLVVVEMVVTNRRACLTNES